MHWQELQLLSDRLLKDYICFYHFPMRMCHSFYFCEIKPFDIFKAVLFTISR